LWKAIACDIDGTLTDENHLLSLEALTAIRSAERAGLPLILSSARTRLELRMVTSLFGTSGPVVAENGGIVWNRTTGEERILGNLENAQKAYKVISSYISDLEILLEGYRETDVMIRGRRAIEIEPIVETEGLDVNLLESAHVTCITDSSVSKGTGLRIATDMIGIEPSEVAAIGDGHNDIALFEAAGAGYAVANADPRLKDAATKVMDRSYGCGCADAIREILGDHLKE